MYIFDDLIAVVVLYKLPLNDSTAIRTLTKSLRRVESGCMDLVIYDNHPSTNDGQLLKSNCLKVHYIADYNNSGVSRAYNESAKLGISLKKKYILLLDQDTQIEENFCTELNILLCKSYLLLFPLLISQTGKTISPCNFKMGRGYSLLKSDSNPGLHSIKKRNFLNSGAVISLDLFHRVGGFDENIPLYFSDFNFFERVKVHCSEYYQMKSVFHHDMASNDDSNMEKFLKRFRFYCDGALCCYDSFSKRLLMMFNILTRSLKLGFRHKTFQFLFVCFKSIKAYYAK